MIALIVFGLAVCTPSEARTHALADALEAEIALVREAPDRYYLTIDTAAGVVTLKAGGRTLHVARILDADTYALPAGVVSMKHAGTIPPHAPYASRPGRLGDHRLPLDFVGRLIEGPRTHDRLYFSPPLVVGSPRVPRPVAGTPWIVLGGDDVKSLSSAVDPGTPVILLNTAATGAE